MLQRDRFWTVDCAEVVYQPSEDSERFPWLHVMQRHGLDYDLCQTAVRALESAGEEFFALRNDETEVFELSPAALDLILSQRVGLEVFSARHRATDPLAGQKGFPLLQRPPVVAPTAVVAVAVRRPGNARSVYSIAPPATASTLAIPAISFPPAGVPLAAPAPIAPSATAPTLAIALPPAAVPLAAPAPAKKPRAKRKCYHCGAESGCVTNNRLGCARGGDEHLRVRALWQYHGREADRRSRSAKSPPACKSGCVLCIDICPCSDCSPDP